MPRSEAENQKDVTATEAAFHHAMLVFDTKTLEALTDQNFIWTHHTGEQMTQKQLLDNLSSGRLKYAMIETRDVKVTMYGDAAVVRGVSPRKRAAIPGSNIGDAEPFNAFYTLTFVNQGGVWKAVAMHTSRPN